MSGIVKIFRFGSGRGHKMHEFICKNRSQLWCFRKCHRENLPDWKKISLSAPDWFFQPYSPQSKNTKFGGVLWGQFASANVWTEQPGEGYILRYLQFQHRPLPGSQTIPTCLSNSMVNAIPTHAQAVKKQSSQFPNKAPTFGQTKVGATYSSSESSSKE